MPKPHVKRKSEVGKTATQIAEQQKARPAYRYFKARRKMAREL